MISFFTAAGKRHITKARVAVLTGTVLGTLAIANAAQAGSEPGPMETPLLPGLITGSLAPYTVKAGDTIIGLATRYAVHPVRITKPNKEALADGLEIGEKIYIDQRRIQPGFYREVHGIVLNIPEAQVYLVIKGALAKEYPVAVSTSESRAPLGKMRVVSKHKNPTWYVPKSIQKEMEEKGLVVKTKVPPGPENPLGSRFIGFGDGTFGFHGTLVPSSIKRYASHGCVRFHKHDIEDLYERVHVGMPVRVYYQPVMLSIDRGSVWLSVYPDLYDIDYDFKGAVTRLAKMAGVYHRLNWETVNHAITVRDGILIDAAKPLTKPKPPVAPSQTPTPVPSPSAMPTIAPSPLPSLEPTPVPTESPLYVEPSAEPATPELDMDKVLFPGEPAASEATPATEASPATEATP